MSKPMTDVEYFKRKKQIELDYSLQSSELMQEYVNSNNPIKPGTIVKTESGHNLLVEEITATELSKSEVPLVTYGGELLNSELQPYPGSKFKTKTFKPVSCAHTSTTTAWSPVFGETQSTKEAAVETCAACGKIIDIGVIV